MHALTGGRNRLRLQPGFMACLVPPQAATHRLGGAPLQPQLQIQTIQQRAGQPLPLALPA